MDKSSQEKMVLSYAADAIRSLAGITKYTDSPGLAYGCARDALQEIVRAISYAGFSRLSIENLVKNTLDYIELEKEMGYEEEE